MKLITIYRDENEMSAELTRGFLEANGIKAIKFSSNFLPGWMARFGLPRSHMPFEVAIYEKDEDEARRLLKERDVNN